MTHYHEAIRLNNEAVSLLMRNPSEGGDLLAKEKFCQSLRQFQVLLLSQSEENSHTGTIHQETPLSRTQTNTGTSPVASPGISDNTEIYDCQRTNHLSSDAQEELSQNSGTTFVKLRTTMTMDSDDDMFVFRGLFVLKLPTFTPRFDQPSCSFDLIHIQSTYVVFNMALLHHTMGLRQKNVKALLIAGQLYRLCLVVKSDGMDSITPQQSGDQAATSSDARTYLSILLLGSLNNLSQIILFIECHHSFFLLKGNYSSSWSCIGKEEEAHILLRYMTVLLDDIQEEGSPVLSGDDWSGFVANTRIAKLLHCIDPFTAPAA